MTSATDVWGLGLLLLEAASGDDPYPVGSPEYDEGLGPVHPPAPLWTRRRTPRALSDLLEATTRIDPRTRPPIPEIRAALHDLPGRD